MFTPRELQGVSGIPSEGRKSYKLRQRWKNTRPAKKVEIFFNTEF